MMVMDFIFCMLTPTSGADGFTHVKKIGGTIVELLTTKLTKIRAAI